MTFSLLFWGKICYIYVSIYLIFQKVLCNGTKSSKYLTAVNFEKLFPTENPQSKTSSSSRSVQSLY